LKVLVRSVTRAILRKIRFRLNYEHQSSEKKSVSRQTGFTLIEAFITVTLLGVLASIAVNVYYDYVVRIKVSEVSSVIAPLQTAIGVQVSINGTLPTSLADVEFFSAVSSAFAGDYVSSVSVTNAGAIRIQLKTRADLRTASGMSVLYSPVWSIGSPNVKWSVSGTVPDKYMPDGYQ
jgi:prepilin-type N-terminal cleavage/methylation domain-containing protein